MKTIAILVKKQAVLLVLFSLFSAPLFSQRDQRDIVDFLLETQVIKNYKETRDNIQKVLTSGIVFSNLTRTDYDDLKREYLKAQMQFNAFVNMISEDLKSDSVMKAMGKDYFLYVTKYETAFNKATDAYNKGFMTVYNRITFGGKSKSGIVAAVTAAFTKELVQLLIREGKKIAVHIVVNKFTKPLLLPSWDNLVKEPSEFAAEFKSDPLTDQPVVRDTAARQDVKRDVVSKPVLRSIEGEVLFIDKNGLEMPFIWKDIRNKAKSLASTGGKQEVFTFKGGDFLMSRDTYPENDSFQVKVRSDAGFCLFAFNPSKNEIISAYPLPLGKSLNTRSNLTESFFIEEAEDGFITLPLKDTNPPKENYWRTEGNDSLEYIVVLFSNAQLDHRALYQQIVNEQGDIQVRVNNVFTRNNIVQNNVYRISEGNRHSVRFSAESAESGVLSLVFVLKRQ